MLTRFLTWLANKAVHPIAVEIVLCLVTWLISFGCWYVLWWFTGYLDLPRWLRITVGTCYAAQELDILFHVKDPENRLFKRHVR